MDWLPPLTALRAFEAAGRYGVARAAKELNVTRAAISHQVRVLEMELGVALFTRSNRGMTLTCKGKEYLEEIAASFDAIHRSSRRLRYPSSGHRLVIDSLTSFATDFLLPRIHRFHTRHPEIELEIITLTRSGGGVAFEQTGANVAIRGGSGAGSWPGLHAEKLAHEIQFPVCAPALLKGENAIRRPADLAKHTLLYAIGASEGWRDWLAAAEEAGEDVSKVTLDHTLRFDLFNMSMTAAVGGVGVDLARSPLVDHWMEKGFLVAPFKLKVTSKLAYWLICPEAFAITPTFQSFREWVFAELALVGQVNGRPVTTES